MSPGEGRAVAVIGMSCRLPQAPDVTAFWRLLAEGRSGITDVPPGRADTVGPATPVGGFLDDVDRFDAAFFGISPKEAAAMDPQQRLMLELAWQALEDARTRPADLTGSRTGVFVGAIARDYAAVAQRLGADSVGQHSFTGLQQGLIANRVSYALGLRGPSFTVDAAQASSLVAVHLAADALLRGDATLALAGGVHLVLAPDSGAALAEFGALSPDGCCYTFDARANGFVRGEGGAVVVLKLLADAVADGDRVHCVLLGSAVNNDGDSDGLTVPSVAAQRELLEDAYLRAGVASADDVQYVELHGTGTAVGDPIEAAALGQALGVRRRSPLPVGSVKTNIGHLEGAAGIAGLLKVALSIRFGGLPASLNFRTPNPRIPLDELGLRVRDTGGPWPRPDAPLIAGVSSFGIGGTNCHVVVSSPPEPVEADRPAVVDAVLPHVVSARDRGALRAAARAVRDTPGEPADIGFSLATTRSVLEHRAVVIAGDRAELDAGLAAVADDRQAAGVVTGRATRRGRVVFVLPGQGSQWRGMAADLFESSPVFRARFLECAEELRRHQDWSPVDVLLGAPGTPEFDRTDVVQPMLFAVMVALAEVWRSYGVRPAAVVGHSQGEVAAACIAGALSLADAARVVALRGRVLHELSGPGGLIVARLSVAEVRARLLPLDDRLSVCAVNSPQSTVIGGPADALDTVLAHAEAIELRRVPIRYASHSAYVEPLRAPLREVLAGLTPASGGTPFYSTVTGAVLDGARLDGDYWYRNLREPVLFESATRALAADGHRVFVEISPHPVLTTSIRDTLDDLGGDLVVAGSLRRAESGPRRLLDGMARLFTAGVDVDWSAAFAGTGALPVDLPGYPFQRKRFWLGDGPGDSAAKPAVDTVAVDQDDLVRTHVAAVLGHGTPADVDVSTSFKALGFDSLTAVELRDRLAAAVGHHLPAGVLYDHPTPAALAGHLRALAAGRPTAGPAVVAPAGDEPIAIVATGCRYPGGVRSADDLWRLVAGEVDAITEAPLDRGWRLNSWYDPTGRRPGTSYARHGGFLDRVDLFDADFFGISPREALAMDPQQRLLLELAWEVIERAGIVPGTLAGSDTGVFAGVMMSDYGPRLDNVGDELGGYRLTGTSVSVAAGRIAYVMGLQGPTLTVDTACSSSLVAVHLACRSLRQGECALALAGGAAVMATPGMLIEFSRQHGLATDGRCRAYGADADGTGWSEGAGMVVLERLSDARRNGHPVLALIRGSAINSDGASNGLTAPRGPAQVAVIRTALADAGLTPADVDLVEGHGTGTRLGDPIEAEALLATYGQDRDRPVWLGSLKSNIGHTQAAAGVGGLIKVVEALAHETMPATLHAATPSPHVDWSAGAVALLTAAEPWPRGDRPRRAAVSSFGISGTNGHVIVEEAPQAEPVPPSVAVAGPRPYVLSARTADALPAQAARLAAHLRSTPGLALVDVGRAMATTRTHHRYRTAVVAEDTDGLLAGLAELAAGRPGANVMQQSARTGRVVFVFPGQGSQWPAMATRLLDESPVVRDHLLACAAALDPLTGWSLIGLLRGAPDAPSWDRADVVQPALFAVMTALAQLWRAHGVLPHAVVGHSQGEIAAAWVAGALSLDDAARVVALRSQALTAIAGRGGMVSVPLARSDVDELLAPFGNRIGIAACNGPLSTVVSGDVAALDELLASAERSGLRARRIPVDYASHSPHVDDIRDDVLRLLADIRPRSGDVPFWSTLQGDVIDTVELGPDYWYRNLREPVRYQQVTQLLLDRGHRLFVEVSPHPVLTVGTQETIDDSDTDAVAFGTLRRDDGGRHRVATALGLAYVHGAIPDWSTVFGDGPTPPLPTYAFHGQSYWLAPTDGTRRADVAGAGLAADEHPLLGAAVDLPDGRRLHTGRIATATHPWLADHVVQDAVVVPGAALVELAAHAGRSLGADTHVAELTLHAPMVVPADGALCLQVEVAAAAADGGRAVVGHSRADGGEWTRNASGVLAADPAPPVAEPGPWPPADATPVDLADAYATLAERGYQYGPLFQGLRAMWRSGDELYAELAPVDEPGFAVHPAALDAALHALLVDRRGPLVVPFSWTGVRIAGTGRIAAWTRLRPAGHGATSVSVQDADGAVIATVDALTMRPFEIERQSMYHVAWTPLAAPDGSATPGRWAVAPGDELTDRLADLIGPVPPDEADLLVVPCPAATDADPTVAVRAATGRVLDVLHERLSGTARLVFVTRSAVATHPGEHVADLGAAAVWGLLRAAQAEHPGRVAFVDVTDRASTDDLVHAIGTGEPQVAVRDDQVLVPGLAAAEPGPLRLPDGDGWQVDIARRGSVDGLSVVDSVAATCPIAAGQVRIAVRAAGVNFHDLVLLLDMIGDPGGVGLEGAGVVVEVGPDVAGIAVGDRVMGLFDGAFAPFAVADHRRITPIPDGWTFAEAATVPVAYLTAWFGLTDLAGVRPGDRVVVHAATGGLGTAAVRLAALRDAEVFGTASPAKWPALRALGLPDSHIANSRDASFADAFGEVDVVLNSLAGELVDASLRMLRPGGRFVEMGKTDIRDPRTLPSVTYQPFDLLTDAKPDRIAEIFAELRPLFDQGVLGPLPVTCFDVRRAGDAYRHLSKARHIGKIVLTVPRSLDPAGTVLVTGGTGAIGARIAHRLVTRHSVRHLLLASRRGPAAPGADALCTQLRAAGAEVTVAACDVADPAALRRLLDSVPDEHPLTGVVHAAGALDDGVLAALTPDRFDAVLASKADAAWHLHRLTERLDLAAFVLFSSVVGTAGNAGQANYAAANAFLDALAQRRRTGGAAAVSLAWGLWQLDSGMTGHMTDTDRARMAQSGLGTLDLAAALALFDAGLELDQALGVPVRLDLAALTGPGRSVPPLLRGLVGTRPAGPTGGGGATGLRDRIAGLPVPERHRVLVELIRTHAAAVLGRDSATSIDVTVAFKEQGFDSLTAVELRNRLDAATGHRLPPTLVFDFPNPTALARHLAGEMVPATGGTAAAPPSEPMTPRAVATDLSTATAQELFALIDSELGR